MAADKRSERAQPFVFNSWRDITPMHMSVGTMLHNKTGSWRSIKPVYEDKIPACQNACPAGNDIDGWVKLLERNEIDKAYWHLKREQPFPAILGRVCFKFCETACNRSGLDHCVQINELERFVGDRIDPSVPHPDLPPDHGKRLAVVGSGPAGMAAAYFARLLGFAVTIFEKEPVLGGMLRLGVPNYRLPRHLVDAEFAGLAGMGVETRPGVAVGKDISIEEITSSFDYSFLASGSHRSLVLNLDGGQDSPHVLSGLAMLRQVALGRPLALGRRVLVIGGGNTALDAARTAIRLGSEVTVLYRRTEAEMPAHPAEVQEAREEGVAFRFLTAPERLILDETGAVQELLCCEMALGEPDASGRRQPLKKEDSLFAVAADNIVTAIGEKPDVDYLRELLDGAGTSLGVDDGLCAAKATGQAGVYAGGDILDGMHTVVHAVAAGKRAAIAMDCDRRGVDFAEVEPQITVGHGPALSFAKYRGWQNLNPVRRNDRAVVDANLVVYDYFQKLPPSEPQVQAANERNRTFEPYRATFSAADAGHEASRCMHCGRCTECDNCLVFCPEVSVLDQTAESFGYSIDYDYCKGCGICSTECPRHAISMVSEATPINEEV